MYFAGRFSFFVIYLGFGYSEVNRGLGVLGESQCLGVRKVGYMELGEVYFVGIEVVYFFLLFFLQAGYVVLIQYFVVIYVRIVELCIGIGWLLMLMWFGNCQLEWFQFIGINVGSQVGLGYDICCLGGLWSLVYKFILLFYCLVSLFVDQLGSLI